MRIAVFGTGEVGHALATKLVQLGHEVMMGSRQAGNEKALAWAGEHGELATEGAFADAAAHGELIVNATNGAGTLPAFAAASDDDLAGKVVIDVSNALDFSEGFPPKLFVSNDDSLGERLQRAHPSARVVKTLNTVANEVMVDPGALRGPHTLFLSGDDAGAKHEVRRLLQTFGWPEESFLDLGDITTARGAEMYVALWVRMFGAVGTPRFNVNVVTE